MKLSKLVQYLNHLDTLSVASAASVSVAELANINHIVRASEVQIPKAVDQLISNLDEITVLLDQYENNLKKLRSDVFELIQQQEPEYFFQSTELYRQMRNDTPKYILKRTIDIDQETLLFLRTRLQSYTDWRWPGMVIRPAQSPWVADLVALDPLYFVDTHTDLISPAVSKFTPEYQRRIRQYVIDEYTDKPAFWNLPQRQFRFVYAFFYFNFKPWEILKQYLTEVFDLLRDGGTFLFSFNDCDQWRAVGVVENHFCCYVPGRLVREHAGSLGYEIAFEHTQAAVTWLELRRPGMLKSIRGGQAVAMILQKPEPEVVDMPIKELYNSLDLSELIDLANRLSIDISSDKTKGMFNIKKVRRTVEQYLFQQDWPETQLRILFKRNQK